MTDVNAPKARPLSPHIQIYGWNWTFMMSGFHRASGFAIYFGSVIPLIWILSLALGEDCYNWVTWLYGTWFFGTPILIAYSWGVIHHALGGVRHFIWDCCYGLERKERFLFAKATLAGSVSLTVLLWIVVFALRIMA
jgi:succinate dehydrogenase, cytochrome b556 subunit